MPHIVPTNRLATHAGVGNAVGMSSTMRLRPIARADAAELLELAVACDIAEVGEPMSTAEEIAADFRNPDLEIVGLAGAGGLVGYAWVEARAGHSRVWADARARLDQQAALDPLLDWVQRRAADLGSGRPIWIFSGSDNKAKVARLEAAGGSVVRRFYRMLIDFDVTGPPEPPSIGDGIEISALEQTGAARRELHRIVESAFVDHFGHEPISYEDWERDAIGGCSDPSLYWIATVDGEPAAGLYACELPAAGYVDTLGTLREFRGRGIGRALLLTAFGEFARRGVHRVSLGVDATSQTGAVGLYQAAGMTIAREGWRFELPPAS